MIKLNFVNSIKDIPSDAIIDVDKELGKIKLNGSDTERNLIRTIEEGRYEDPMSFIDRFDCKLPKQNLSTGCKAGLVVYHRPNIGVALLNCGYNAVSAILQFCRNGIVYAYEPDIPYICFDTLKTREVAIDVELDGKQFYNMKELNDYIHHEV